MDTDTNTDSLKNGSQAQYKLAKKYFDECRLKESLELAIKAASNPLLRKPPKSALSAILR